MTKYLYLTALLNWSIFSWGQKPDTLSPEGRIQWRLQELRTAKAEANVRNLAQTVSELTDMAMNRAPYSSMKALRSGVVGMPSVVYINEGVRSGRFILDTTDIRSRDDGSMVLVMGKNRYKRESLGYLRPEWFGANPHDDTDDAPAIQSAFNTATNAGLEVLFSEGTYLIGTTLKPKKIGDGAQFKISLIGKGQGLTIIKGLKGMNGDNILEFVVPDIKPKTATYIMVRDIEFVGNGASRIIFANNICNLDLQDCSFMGGDTCGVQIGDKITENYGIYVNRCYFNGLSSNNGHNLANLRMYARYPVISQMVCDGSQYGIDLYGDRAFIEKCLFEGNKRAGILIKSSAGGGHKIIGNDFLLYGGYEPNARFNGTLTGIYIENVKGGSSNSIISNNWFYIPKIKSQVLNVSQVKGKLIPSHTYGVLTGSSTKSSARLIGFDPAENRMVVDMISGDFVNGEMIRQDHKNKGQAMVNAKIDNKTYGLQLLGSWGGNIISGNQIRGATSVAVNVLSRGNIIEGNFIEAENGIELRNDASIVNNSMYCPNGFAINRVTGTAVVSGNVMDGELINVEDLYSIKSKTSVGGELNVSDLSVFETNAEAKAQGLKVGQIYRTSEGELKVCF